MRAGSRQLSNIKSRFTDDDRTDHLSWNGTSPSRRSGRTGLEAGRAGGRKDGRAPPHHPIPPTPDQSADRARPRCRHCPWAASWLACPSSSALPARWPQPPRWSSVAASACAGRGGLDLPFCIPKIPPLS